MNIISRGMRNAFRNMVRTVSIVMIIGLMLGLSLVMLVAHRAVDSKVQSTLSSIGTTILVLPAGFSGSSAVSTALDSKQLESIAKTPHVSSMIRTLGSQLQPAGTTNNPQVTPGGGSEGQNTSPVFKTSLKTPHSINCDDDLCSGTSALRKSGDTKAPELPDNFSPPITVIGTTAPSDPRAIGASKLTLTQGKLIDGMSERRDVLLSEALAKKNNLTVGSSFEAFDATLKVAGIFAADTRAGNNTIILSLPALQAVSRQDHTITQAIVTVDSLTNLQSTTTTIKQRLGDKADVISKLDEAKLAIGPLETVKQISLYSLLGACLATAIALLLIMAMIVRERKREIGVLKAIGFSTGRIGLQFVVEALTLTTIAALVGTLIGALAASPMTSALIAGSQTETEGVLQFDGSLGNLQHVQASLGWELLASGLAVALLIALLSSSVTSLFIAKIKPAEVLRGE